MATTEEKIPHVESKEGANVDVLVPEYLSESDDDFNYDEIPESDSDIDDGILPLGMDMLNIKEETLASIESGVHRRERVSQHLNESDSSSKTKTLVRPSVIDDFFRKFLIKIGMDRTLDAFNTEWYELQSKGKLNAEHAEVVPDIYLRNEELDEKVKVLRDELEVTKQVCEKAQSTWDKFRKERDTHRMHHKRVVQEKKKLIVDIKRLKKHYSSYEPTLRELRNKYEHAMKEKMLMRLERDKLAARTETLEMQLKNLESMENTSMRHDRSPKKLPAVASASSGQLHTTSQMSSTRSNGFLAGTANAEPTQRKRQDCPLPEDSVNPYLGKVFDSFPVAGLQLQKTYEGHVNSISSIACHPKQNVVATASDDHTVKLWEVSTGTLILVGEGHTSWVSDVDFHPGGAILASCSGDTTIKIWDFREERPTATLTEHAQPIWGVSWHHSGDFLVSGSMDHTAKLWDAHTFRVRQTFRGHVDSVNAVAFQPFSANVCTGAADKTVSVWDSRSGLCVQTFYGHSNSCNDIAFNLNGDTIASCDADGVVKLWDVRMVQEIGSISDSDMPLNSVTFDRSGQILAAASDDSSIKFFDVTNQEVVCQLVGHSDAVQSVAFDPNSKYFVSGGSDATFRLWQ